MLRLNLKLPSRRDINSIDVEAFRSKALKEKEPVATVFIHGLGSNPTGTWGSMVRFLLADVDVKPQIFDFYTFPTAIINLIPIKPLPKIQHLARGLATELRLRHSDREQVTLVCHSLGGLVARQYILDELKAGRKPIPNRILFLSTPHNGATIASIGTHIGLGNAQTRQLAQYSDLLQRINDEWEGLNAEQQVDVSYVWAAQDLIVNERSAGALRKSGPDDTLIDYNHSTISKVYGSTDTNYILVKKYINGFSAHVPEQNSTEVKPPNGNPLFEVYEAISEPYYLKRSVDDAVFMSSKSSHIWLHGRSGNGKTAALKRNCIQNGYHLQHIMLSSYENPTSNRLLAAIVSDLGDRLGGDLNGLSPQSTAATSISYLRRLLRNIDDARPLAILIEEIPLTSGREYQKFLSNVKLIIQAIEQEQRTDTRIFLSSIVDPLSNGCDDKEKLHGQVQFLSCDDWTGTELLDLAVIINDATGTAVSADQLQSIVLGASGSPRFVKSVFRKLVIGAYGGDIASVINLTKTEGLR